MLCMCVYAESTTTTNMSQRNTNKISDRFRPTYSALKRSKKSPYSGQISDRTGDEVRKDPLSNYDRWPGGHKPEVDPIFVRLHKTLRVQADDCMSEFEYNYLGVALKRVPYKVDDQRQLEDMFQADPLGLEEVPVDDVNCWQIRTVVRTGETSSHGLATATKGAPSTSLKASATAAAGSTKPADATHKTVGRGKGPRKPRKKREGRKKKRKRKRREAKQRAAEKAKADTDLC